MKRLLIHLIVNTITLMVVAGYFDKFHLSGIGAAILASILLTFINMFVKPLLIIFTLPVTVITFGLFLFVINAITLYLTAEIMGDQFVIEGFSMAIIASIIISILNTLIHKMVIEPLQRKMK